MMDMEICKSPEKNRAYKAFQKETYKINKDVRIGLYTKKSNEEHLFIFKNNNTFMRHLIPHLQKLKTSTTGKKIILYEISDEGISHIVNFWVKKSDLSLPNFSLPMPSLFKNSEGAMYKWDNERINKYIYDDESISNKKFRGLIAEELLDKPVFVIHVVHKKMLDHIGIKRKLAFTVPLDKNGCISKKVVMSRLNTSLFLTNYINLISTAFHVEDEQDKLKKERKQLLLRLKEIENQTDLTPPNEDNEEEDNEEDSEDDKDEYDDIENNDDDGEDDEDDKDEDNKKENDNNSDVSDIDDIVVKKKDKIPKTKYIDTFEELESSSEEDSEYLDEGDSQCSELQSEIESMMEDKNEDEKEDKNENEKEDKITAHADKKQEKIELNKDPIHINLCGEKVDPKYVEVIPDDQEIINIHTPETLENSSFPLLTDLDDIDTQEDTQHTQDNVQEQEKEEKKEQKKMRNRKADKNIKNDIKEKEISNKEKKENREKNKEKKKETPKNTESMIPYRKITHNKRFMSSQWSILKDKPFIQDKVLLKAQGIIKKKSNKKRKKSQEKQNEKKKKYDEGNDK